MALSWCVAASFYAATEPTPGQTVKPSRTPLPPEAMSRPAGRAGLLQRRQLQPPRSSGAIGGLTAPFAPEGLGIHFEAYYFHSIDAGFSFPRRRVAYALCIYHKLMFVTFIF